MDDIDWHIENIERSLVEIKRLARCVEINDIEVDKYLTTTDFAKRCGCSRSKVINMINNGDIRSTITGGGHNRISEKEADRIIELWYR